jgi:hypothetical protein
VWGGAITVKSGATPTTPRVASCTLGQGTFFVVWEEGGDIRGRTVSATGALAAEVVIAGGTDTQTSPAIGGETDGRSGVVVWDNATQNTIEGRGIAATGVSISMLSTATIGSGNTSFLRFVDDPAIARSGGPSDRYLVAWSVRNGIGTLASSQIAGRVVDRTAAVVGTQLTIASTALYRTRPAVDGDGSEWMVAWQNAADSTSTDHDIAVCTVTWDPNASTPYVNVAERVIEGDVNDDEIEPWVANLGASYLVGYSDQGIVGSTYGAYVQSLDPATCTACEGELPIDVRSNDEARTVRAAGKSSSGLNVDEALVVWRTGTGGFLSTTRGWRFDARGVALPSVTPSCGQGGQFRATCAVLSHAQFQMRLQGAVAGQPAFLVLSPYARIVGCGPCALAPDPFRGIVISAGVTDATGEATVLAPIPSSVPVALFYNLYAQWLVMNPGAACGLGFDMSNSLGLIIQ